MIPTRIDDFLKYAQIVRDDLAQTSSSGYLLETDLSSPVSALKSLPMSIVYFLSVPFSWESGSLRQNLVLPETIFWLFLYPAIFLGMKRGLRLNFQGNILLITITVVMTCFYSLYVSNIGTAYRMRSQIWLFWVIFVGWSHEHRYMKRARNSLPVAGIKGSEIK